VPDQSDMPDQVDRSGMSAVTELSASEAAQVLGVAERSVRRYIARGTLPARRVMSERGVQEYRISAADVAAFQGRRAALDHEGAPVPDRVDMPDRVDRVAVQDVPHPAALALQAALAGVQAELSAAREEREQLRAERAALAAHNALLHDLTARQAEELGAARERARQAEERAAQLERAVRRQQRPWWLRLLG